MLRGEGGAVGPHPRDHHQLFECGVAGTLADAVDGAFDLARAAVQRRDAVGNRETEVVVAVRAEDYLLAAADRRDDRLEVVADLVGRRVADGVRQVDRRGARGNDGFDHRRQVRHVAAGRVLGRELHVVGELAGLGDGLDGGLEALLARDAQLALEVQVGCRDEGVDAPLAGGGDGLAGAFDVGGGTSGEGSNRRSLHLLRDPPHRLGIVHRRDREPGLDDVHAERFEPTRQRQLLGDAQREAGRLFAIAKGRVEDEDIGSHADRSPACHIPRRATC